MPRAIGPETGLILKVHPSNYRDRGLHRRGRRARELAALAREHGVPLVNDLGSGTLVDLARFGLPHEPTVAEAVADGADLVTFSGDKLLGGPQAGFIVGRADLIARINRNPLKRALRLDKMRLAALEATLRLYRDPDRLAERLPTLRLLARPRGRDRGAGRRRRAGASPRGSATRFDGRARRLQQPDRLRRAAGRDDAERRAGARAGAARGQGRALAALGAALRGLPMPVIGRIADGALVLDLRCLEDEAAFLANLAQLDPAERPCACLSASSPTPQTAPLSRADGGRRRAAARRLRTARSPSGSRSPMPGVARAQNNIGACFADGFGVERDPTLAVRWLTLAAEAGDAVAQRNLATLLLQGRGRRAGFAAGRRALPRGRRAGRRGRRRTC